VTRGEIMFGARRLKIRVKTKDVNINLPGIPLAILSSLVTASSYYIKHSKKHRDEDYAQFASLVKPLLKEFRDCPPFDFVDVIASDGTVVNIRLL